MTNTEHDNSGIGFSPALELKFIDSGSAAGEFTGHAAMFNTVDSHRDIIRPGAFSASLASHKTADTMPALLWSHDQSKPVGKLLSIAEDGQGLRVHGRFNLGTTAGRDAHAHVKDGDSTGMSIGYQVPAGGAVHGRDGVRTLQRLAVHEVSLVTLPSHSNARVREVKSLANPAELERLLRDAGLSSRAAERIAAAGFPALTKSAEPEIDFDRVADVLRRQALELKSWNH